MFLAGLWALSVLPYLGLALSGFWMAGRRASVALMVVGLLMTGVSLLLGIGLWLRSPWARVLQMVVAGAGLLTCAFTPLAGVVLAYMLQPATRIQFSGRTSFRDLSDAEAQIVRTGTKEGLFAGGLVAALVAGAVLAGVIAALAIPAIARHA
jgi:hypothetical protein